ncbi:MAG: YbhB/YbcL family Raf kinase inhibitor-like protein [Chloroflexi bacterium]|nr:YbhB/YbcL family Raf kinase inhibitor-like protein [Chloroflexota bacterium]
MKLTSPVFAYGEPIPRKYTCDGEDISPPLQWGDAPADAASFALIMDDPDAPVGTWDHWLIFDIPPTATGLPEGIPSDAHLSDGSVQGTNSWQRIGYGGPCPPRGQHRYFFRLYTLDSKLKLGPETNKASLLKAMKGHVLAQAELMGVYQR